MNITLPEGVTSGPGREVAQPNGLGSVEAGMIFPLILPNGSSGTIFLTYAQLKNPEQAEQLIAERVALIGALG